LQALSGSVTDGFLGSPPDLDGATHLGLPGITGAARPRGPWDAVATARAPELPVDTLTFVALADGTLVVDDDVPDGSVEPLATAVERELAAPYEAAALRDGDGLWRVVARSVLIAPAAGEEADAVELARLGDDLSVTVDGAEAARGAAPPALVELLEQVDGDAALTAERLDETTWVAERWAL
jgi:hypothetical protein